MPERNYRLALTLVEANYIAHLVAADRKRLQDSYLQYNKDRREIPGEWKHDMAANDFLTNTL